MLQQIGIIDPLTPPVAHQSGQQAFSYPSVEATDLPVVPVVKGWQAAPDNQTPPIAPPGAGAAALAASSNKADLAQLRRKINKYCANVGMYQFDLAAALNYTPNTLK